MAQEIPLPSWLTRLLAGALDSSPCGPLNYHSGIEIQRCGRAPEQGHFMLVLQASGSLQHITKHKGEKKNTDDIIATFQLSTSLGHVYSFLASPIHLSCYIL